MAVKDKRLSPFDDPAVTAALGQQPAGGKPQAPTVYDRMAKARGMTPAQRRKLQFDQARTKASYDLPPEMIQLVDEIADACKAPRGQVAAYLMAYGLRALQDGSANLGWAIVASPSVRFMSKITLPEYPETDALKDLLKELKERW